MRSVPFRNRAHAGRQLAARLADLGLGDDVVVLALPPGGVSVGHEVAVRLDARLEILVARNLCAPRQAELAVGAIAEGDVRVLDERMLEALAVNARELDEITARERRELERWVRLYRGGELPEMAGRSAVLVDDGLAVGMTAEAALQSVRAHAPDRLVLAVPVCSQATAQRLRPLVDDSVCLAMPPELLAVGEWYEDFPHATNAEVLDFLERLRESSVMTRPMLGGSGGDEPTNQRS